jgi:hypothetical protein
MHQTAKASPICQRKSSINNLAHFIDMQLKHTFNSPKIAQLLLQGNETHLSIAVVLVPSLRVEEVVLKLPPRASGNNKILR